MNWMNGRLPIVARVVLVVASFFLIDGGLLTDLMGLVVLAGTVIWRFRLMPTQAAVAGVPAVPAAPERMEETHGTDV